MNRIERRIADMRPLRAPQAREKDVPRRNRWTFNREALRSALGAPYEPEEPVRHASGARTRPQLIRDDIFRELHTAPKGLTKNVDDKRISELLDELEMCITGRDTV